MRNHNRSESNTVLGISMPKAIKDKIRRAAELDNRTMANWCLVQLERIIAQKDAAQDTASVGTTKKMPLEALPPEAGASTTAQARGA
jgi:hypothetical protein